MIARISRDKVCGQNPDLGPWKYAFFIRNQFIGNLVLDSLKFNKFLELQGKRYETLECSVPSFTVSEVHFSSTDLEVSTYSMLYCK